MSDETATTEYCYLSNVIQYRELIDEVREFLGEFVEQYDVDTIVSDYDAAINAALPDGISLNGNTFHGPYPAPTDAAEQISAALDTVDLAAIVEQHTT